MCYDICFIQDCEEAGERETLKGDVITATRRSLTLDIIVRLSLLPSLSVLLWSDLTFGWQLYLLIFYKVNVIIL